MWAYGPLGVVKEHMLLPTAFCYRRGTPLILNEESFQQLQKVWFQHRIPERITQEIESNRNLLRIVWSQM